MRRGSKGYVPPTPAARAGPARLQYESGPGRGGRLGTRRRLTSGAWAFIAIGALASILAVALLCGIYLAARRGIDQD